MNDFVTLEQARRLKAAGFPQMPKERQLAYLLDYPEGFIEQPQYGRWKTEIAENWVAAPPYLRALEWLEREKGIVWERWEGPSLGQAWWIIVHHDSRRFRTASDLLDAILDRIETDTPQAAVEGPEDFA